MQTLHVEMLVEKYFRCFKKDPVESRTMDYGHIMAKCLIVFFAAQILSQTQIEIPLRCLKILLFLKKWLIN